MKYGLLGKALGHSFSPHIHAELGDYKYELYERGPDQIEELLLDPDLKGLNVTIPYKEHVMKYCDTITDRASSIGCVNTLIFGEELVGDNTDYFGFSFVLDRMNLDVENKQVIIIGDGATSKTVEAVLIDRGSNVVKLSRKTPPLIADIKSYCTAAVVINTTPVGMYPNNGDKLIDLDIFEQLEAVIDVVYNPLRTALLLDAKKRSIPYSNGLPMLVGQAAGAAELFTGRKYSNEDIERVLSSIGTQTGNIVLVGMPGSGKSSIGKELGLLTGKKYVDLDAEIEKTSGMSIPEIFESRGESYFRELETRLCNAFGKLTDQVISCGGGVVTRDENYEPLAQNGRIYFIRRDLNSLAKKGRPLSKDISTLELMWIKRKPLYDAFSDLAVDNISIKETAKFISEEYHENFVD